jgi:hypothetical protein
MIPERDVRALGEAASALALPEDCCLYEREIQLEVRDALRRRAPAVFDSIDRAIHERIKRPPYAALIGGLPPEHGTPLLVAFSAGLGALVEPYRQAWSKVVRHIIPSRDRAIDGHVLNEFIHTDGTDWPVPNDFTCLFCMEPDQDGTGQSRLLDVESIVEDLDAREPGLADRLACEPMPWRLADELGGGAYWTPVLGPSRDRIRWLRYTIALALKEDVPLSAESCADLERAEELMESNPAMYNFSLQRGELLIVENTRCLHGRTPIPWAAGSRRHLLRTKIARCS